MIPTVLGSLSLRQGGTWGAYYGPMERSPIGWLNGLISCICSAWLNGIVSLNVLSWTERSSPRHAHSASMRGRWSRWHYYQCHVTDYTDIYRTSVFTEIATSHMIPTVLGSLSLRQGGTWGAYYGPMERSPIGWLNGLISCICSAWLNGIVSLNVLSWTEQSSPRHTHSASMRDRWSRWHYYYQCHVTDIYRTSVFTEIATSHRLKKTPLCVSGEIILGTYLHEIRTICLLPDPG